MNSFELRAKNAMQNKRQKANCKQNKRLDFRCTLFLFCFVFVCRGKFAFLRRLQTGFNGRAKKRANNAPSLRCNAPEVELKRRSERCFFFLLFVSHRNSLQHNANKARECRE